MSNAAAVAAYDSHDSGGNTGWTFPQHSVWTDRGRQPPLEQSLNWSDGAVPTSFAVFNATDQDPCWWT